MLLRHGHAEDFHPEGDASRSLTEKGREQAARAARLLQAAGRLPSLVLTSPYARARQTAEIFCETAGLPGPVKQSWLACGMVAPVAWAELAGFQEFTRILLVGHEPDFSQLACQLVGAPAGVIQVKKGGLVGMRIMPLSRRGELRFLLPPKLAAEME
jgi:phosphohistidine phosphatase